MSSRIEVESKYFCKDIKKLYKIIENEKMKEIANINEVDEYFTDVNSEYIKNRVCLRIRKTDGKDMELTFKGKSSVLSSSYAKKESNFKLNINDYEELVSFLSSLGFYSYVEVNKKRKVFSRTEDDLIYNIMIDYINDIGEFVEFELLSLDDNKLIDLLENKLEQFIYKFKEANLDVAKLPYRDFVALNNYNNFTFNKEKDTLLLDLDGTLINSEHEFFYCFKNIIYSKFGYEISLDEYVDNELNKNNNLINYLKEMLIIKKDILEEDIMKLVYNLYEKSFINILENEDTAVNIELLKKLKKKGIRLAIVSTSQKRFIDLLTKRFKLDNLFDVIISRESVENLKPNSEAYSLALAKLNIKKENCIVVEDSYRGIISAQNIGLDVVSVYKYSLKKQIYNKVINIKEFSKLALVLLNN